MPPMANGLGHAIGDDRVEAESAPPACFAAVSKAP